MHGTGTPLGDPIEMGALGSAASRQSSPLPAPMVIGSVKSCYGHTEGCAGLTGALLAIHALQHEVKCPELSCCSVLHSADRQLPVRLLARSKLQ